jgi:hypothetical protein
MTIASAGARPTPELVGLTSDDTIIKYGRDWLTERATLKDYRENFVSFRDFVLEMIVIYLIFSEISSGNKHEKHQDTLFSLQQTSLNSLNDRSADTVDSLKQLKTATDTLAQTMQKALEQASKNAEASEKSARAAQASAETAIKALHVSERAYISATPEPKSTLKAGEKFTIGIDLFNSGKTAALDVVGSTKGLSVPSELTVDAAYKLSQTLITKGVASKTPVFAGGHLEQNMDSGILSDQDVLEITSGAKTYYIFVDIEYVDVYGKRHHTRTCAFYNSRTTHLSPCDSLSIME